MISNKPVAAENKRAEDNFKAKSDESEQDEAALATTPNMNGRKVVCRSQTGILLLYSCGCFKDCRYIVWIMSLLHDGNNFICMK
jgi:hypothetical protein